MDDNLTPKNNDESSSSVSVILNLESLIKSHFSSIGRLQEELKKYKGMLDDILNNDSTYKTHSEQAKEAARIKSNTKKQILNRPDAADLNNKVKSMQSQLKETQGALSDYLAEFQRLSGLSEIETEDGTLRQIVFVPKLVAKRD